MSITVAWDNEQSAIRQTLSGPWSWTEWESAAEALTAMLDSVKHSVDILLDLREAGLMGPETYARLASSPSPYNHPGRGRLVVIGTGTTAQLVMALVEHAFPNGSTPIYFAPTPEKARTLLSLPQPS